MSGLLGQLQDRSFARATGATAASYPPERRLRHAFGRLSGTLTDGTATSGMWVRGTFCLRKAGHDWLIVHDQASVPLDTASGRGVTDLEP
jgi:hypothetical protein